MLNRIDWVWGLWEVKFSYVFIFIYINWVVTRWLIMDRSFNDKFLFFPLTLTCDPASTVDT